MIDDNRAFPTRPWVQTPPGPTLYNKYTLLDGLGYNMCGYFASCVVFFRAPQGRGKIPAMSNIIILC